MPRVGCRFRLSAASELTAPAGVDRKKPCIFILHIKARGLALDCTGKQRRSRDSLDQNSPEAAKAGAVRHFARVRYCHFLSRRLPESLSSASSSLAASSSSTDDLVPRTVSYWYFRWRWCTLAHMRRAGRRYSVRSLTESVWGGSKAPGDRHRDLSSRSWWLYHQEARVTREWTEPADRADRLSTDWAPLTAGPTENEARLGATSTWEPGMWASPVEPTCESSLLKVSRNDFEQGETTGRQYFHAFLQNNWKYIYW